MKGKDRARAKELFRQMTPAEKLDHIRTYYTWHIVGVIAGLLALVMIGFAVYNNYLHRNDLCVAVQEEYSVALMPILEHVTQEIGWEEDISYTSVVSTSDVSGDGINQIMVQLAANEMDVLVCGRDTMEFITDDPEVTYAVYELQETVLGRYAQREAEIYVLFFTGPKQEKTQRFEQLLLDAA